MEPNVVAAEDEAALSSSMNDPGPSLPTLSFLLPNPGHPIIHRDLSWIQFNDRVLAEARSKSNPVLSRMKFLSITASNLDEFFMIRFASLVRSVAATKAEDRRESLLRVHGTVLESVRKFALRQSTTLDILRKAGEAHRVNLHVKTNRGSAAFLRGRELFLERVLPYLAIKNKFGYPRISELQNLQLLVYINQDIWFEIPRTIPPVFYDIDEAKDRMDVFFLDELLLSHLDAMLPLKDKPGILRATRDADYTIDLPDVDTESIPDIVRKNISGRDRGRLVRLQWNGTFPKDFLAEACDTLKLDLRQCFHAPGTLCLNGLFGFVSNVPDKMGRRPGFQNPHLRSSLPGPFEEARRPKLFDAIGQLDFLLHHPYDSFDAFIAFLRTAAEDPDVTMIEQTIYRTDSDLRIVDILKQAAQAKKKVRVILELRARFDENNNLRVAEELSKAGAEVKFGFGALKLHAKVTLVTRKQGEKTQRYTHLSTGNYNAKTARQYTDISILTSNPEIGLDARHFFDSVYKKEVPTNFRHLVTAPTGLHLKIRQLVKAETEAAKSGKPARIIAKVNALVDEKIIEDLYLASQAGVQIDLIVRGACSLVPGVKGLSDNIRVSSIVDRFLEHSRIYYFQQTGAMYLSSADWMPRNFFSRLEIAFPVLDRRLYRFIAEVLLPGYLRDNVRARRLTPRGVWAKVPPNPPLHRAQWYFEELANGHYRETPLSEHPFFQDPSRLEPANKA
jgi:polyphosphate kinase